MSVLLSVPTTAAEMPRVNMRRACRVANGFPDVSCWSWLLDDLYRSRSSGRRFPPENTNTIIVFGFKLFRSQNCFVFMRKLNSHQPIYISRPIWVLTKLCIHTKQLRYLKMKTETNLYYITYRYVIYIMSCMGFYQYHFTKSPLISCLISKMTAPIVFACQKTHKSDTIDMTRFIATMIMTLTLMSAVNRNRKSVIATSGHF